MLWQACAVSVVSPSLRLQDCVASLQVFKVTLLQQTRDWRAKEMLCISAFCCPVKPAGKCWVYAGRNQLWPLIQRRGQLSAIFKKCSCDWLCEGWVWQWWRVRLLQLQNGVAPALAGCWMGDCMHVRKLIVLLVMVLAIPSHPVEKRFAYMCCVR